MKKVMIVKPLSSVTSVMSGITGALRRYVEGNFPERYFADYHVDTDISIARRRIRQFRPLSTSAVSMRRFPLLSIRADPSADPSPMSTGSEWDKGNRFMRDPVDLPRIISDDIARRYVGIETQRVVCHFNVTVTVQSDMKGREIMMYMRRVLPIGQMVFLNEVNIQTEVPQQILRAIWDDMGLTDASDPDQVEELHQYLRAFTAGGIERLVNTATGRTGFYFQSNYAPVLLMSTPSLNVSRDGNVVKSAQVSLPVDVDVEIPMSYAARIEEPAEPTPETGDFIIGGTETAYFGSRLVGMPPHNTGEHMVIGYQTSIITEPGVPRTATNLGKDEEPDVTDVSAFVSRRFRAYVDGDATIAREARLWNAFGEMPPGDFSFDWDAWTLTIAPGAVLPSHKYVVALYADQRGLAASIPISDRPGVSPLYAPPAS